MATADNDRRSITIYDIIDNTNTLSNYDDRVAALVRYPWQIVIYKNNICYIVPSAGIQMYDYYYEPWKRECRKAGFDDSLTFCNIISYENLFTRHYTNTTHKCLTMSIKKLKKLTPRNIDTCYYPLELISGESFVDFCHKEHPNYIQDINIDHIIDRYTSKRYPICRALLEALSEYIEKAVDLYNREGNAAMSFYLQNRTASIDAWSSIPINTLGHYKWPGEDNNKKPVKKEEPVAKTAATAATPAPKEPRAPKKKSPKRIKFIRGCEYKLRTRGMEGMDCISATYRCVQIINSIKENIVDIVIMKSISPHPLSSHNIYCLNRLDCLKYHIKYEDGLEVFSQMMNWIPVKKKAVIKAEEIIEAPVVDTDITKDEKESVADVVKDEKESIVDTDIVFDENKDKDKEEPFITKVIIEGHGYANYNTPIADYMRPFKDVYVYDSEYNKYM